MFFGIIRKCSFIFVITHIILQYNTTHAYAAYTPSTAQFTTPPLQSTRALPPTNPKFYKNVYPTLEKYNADMAHVFWDILQKQLLSAQLTAPFFKPQEERETIIVRNGRRYRKKTPVYSKKSAGDYFALWVDGSLGSMNIQHNKTKLNDTLLSATLGLNIKELDIPGYVRFNFHLFANYTRGIFRIEDNTLPSLPDGTATMIASGGIFAIESLFHPNYQVYFRAGAWATMFENKLEFNSRKIKDMHSHNTWGFYTINATGVLGTKISVKSVFIVPQIDVLYRYTPAYTMNTDKNTVPLTYKERHLLTGRFTTTVGYAFPIGLQPYIRLGAEMNFDFSKDKNIYIGDMPGVHYKEEDVNILGGLGLLYAGKTKNITYSAFIDFTSVLGLKSQEYIGNLGFTIGF